MGALVCRLEDSITMQRSDRRKRHWNICREKIRIRDGSPDVRREHVELFIRTLDDRYLSKQLTLLRLEDADEMKETLRAHQRMVKYKLNRLQDRINSDRDLHHPFPHHRRIQLAQ